MGVIGETCELACVDGCGDGLIGERLVGEVTESEERLRESAVLSPGLSLSVSDMVD